jgi:hypothetical protein
MLSTCYKETYTRKLYQASCNDASLLKKGKKSKKISTQECVDITLAAEPLQPKLFVQGFIHSQPLKMQKI